MVKKKPSKPAARKFTLKPQLSKPIPAKTLDDVAGENQEIAKFNRLKGSST